ncbi:MAG: hypothetical protein KJ668_00675 [Proteobacteria bacterium]|nr:hypothetical protein [Pseudomonadota bacterium]MBU2630917.1 hypothetical protein [Pseudomonadota bacterium]
MMKKDIPCGEENFGLVPISLKVNNGRIVWIEHSINEKKSCIKQFHLQNNQELIVQTFDFLPEAEHIKFSSFFLELKGNMLFFDKRESENRIFIVRWDVGSNQQVDQWKVKEDIVLHYKNIQQQCNIYCSTEYFRGNC